MSWLSSHMIYLIEICMKAAIVLEAGKTPVYSDFKEPVPAEGEVRVHVTASALSTVARSRASGTHYTSSGDLPLSLIHI